MAVPKNIIFEQFLAPVVKLLIDQDALKRFYKSIDWQTERDRISQSNLVYPTYYSSQNFHSIEGGYLTINAAVSYDPITQYALPPSEQLVRQRLIDTIQPKPRRILDVGCGTGSTTLMLKQAFPDAEVIGLDLSPYMLIVAEHKARQAGLDIQFRHGNAEHTGFPDAYFDVVTASLLFHETPPAVTRSILRESFRLLTVGGEVVVLDGSQKALRQAVWLTEIFEEPYIHDYIAGNLDAWMGTANFDAVETQEFWWLHQITRGVKPLPGSQPVYADESAAEWVGERQWALG